MCELSVGITVARPHLNNQNWPKLTRKPNQAFWLWISGAHWDRILSRGFSQTLNWTNFYSLLAEYQKLYKDDNAKEHVFGKFIDHRCMSADYSNKKSSHTLRQHGRHWQWNESFAHPPVARNLNSAAQLEKAAFSGSDWTPGVPVGTSTREHFYTILGGELLFFNYGCFSGNLFRHHSLASFLPHAWIFHCLREFSVLTPPIQYSSDAVQMVFATTWSPSAIFCSKNEKKRPAFLLNFSSDQRNDFNFLVDAIRQNNTTNVDILRARVRAAEQQLGIDIATFLCNIPIRARCVNHAHPHLINRNIFIRFIEGLKSSSLQ